MPNAECRMPNAECRMPNGEWRMPIAECRMPNAEFDEYTQPVRPFGGFMVRCAFAVALIGSIAAFAAEPGALAGKWFVKVDAASMTVHLRGDGSFETELKSPDGSTKTVGMFQIAGDRLTFQPKDQTPIVYTFALKDGKLTLAGGDLPAGQEITLTKQAGLFDAVVPKNKDPVPALPDPATKIPPEPPARDLGQLTYQLLSQRPTGHYSDAAVAPDGSIHVAYSEAGERFGETRHLYHQSSTDGGHTWSQRQNLSHEYDRNFGAGFHRIVIDGKGRVYVVWKPHNHQDTPCGNSEGDLVFRVLDGGSWSKPIRVGTEKHVLGWFPSVNPAGIAHLVWNEDAPLRSDGSRWSGARNAMLVHQCVLDGPAASPPVRIWGDKPILDDMTLGKRYPGYKGIRGYVDARGTAHWVAEKIPAKIDHTDVELVHCDGVRETVLFQATRFGSVSLVDRQFNRSPLQLLVDSAGRQHVVFLDLKGEKPAVIDHMIGSNAEPTIVRAAKALDGEISGVQAIQGAGGRMAVLMQVRDDRSKYEFDLLLSTFDGTRWSPTVDLTGHRGPSALPVAPGFKHLDAHFAAGVFDRAGRLNLAVVQRERSGIYSVNPGVFYLRP